MNHDIGEYEYNRDYVIEHGRDFPWLSIEQFAALSPEHRSVLVEAAYEVENLSNCNRPGSEPWPDFQSKWDLLASLFEQAART